VTFFPSRLESLKRQDLLIEAARLLATDTKILIGGEGPQLARYERLIEARARASGALLGRFSDAERISLYAHALAVAFPPFDEDWATSSRGDVRGEAGRDLPRFGRTARVRRARRDRRGRGRTGGAGGDRPPGGRSRACATSAKPDERIGPMNLSWDRVVATLCA
jgi:hypothetical protein